MGKIYTKTGDRGQTSLMDGSRVSKNHIRVEAYGTIDELNAAIGMVLAMLAESKIKNSHKGTTFTERSHDLRRELEKIQNDLFEIGSALSNPLITHNSSLITYLESHIQEFEKLIDSMTEILPPLTNFILPGGGKAGAQLHIARTIARRAERRIIELMQTVDVDKTMVKYVNRLSDLLYTMSRFINFKEKRKETLWHR